MYDLYLYIVVSLLSEQTGRSQQAIELNKEISLKSIHTHTHTSIDYKHHFD